MLPVLAIPRLTNAPPVPPPDPLTSLGLIAATTSAGSDTCNAPATGIEPGDLLVFCDHAIQTSPSTLPTIVIPDGFAQKAQFDLDTARRFVYSTKIADGTEDGVSFTGMTGNNSRGKAILQFRGNVAITSIGSAGDVGFSGPANIAAGNVSETITASGGTPPLLVIGWASGNGGTNPTVDMLVSAVSVEDGEQFFNGAARNCVNWNFVDSSPADHVARAAGTTGLTQWWAGGFYLPLT